MKINLKTTILRILVSILFIAPIFGYAGDNDGVYSGNVCVPAYPNQVGDFYHVDGGIFNNTNQPRWISCSFPTDNDSTSSYGYVYFYQGGPFDVSTCYLRRRGYNSAYKSEQSGQAVGNSSPSAYVYTTETSPLFSSSDYVTLQCEMAPYSFLTHIQWYP